MRPHIPASKVMNDTTIEVEITGVKLAMLRVKVAFMIMRFAAWIGGFGGIEVETAEVSETPTARGGVLPNGTPYYQGE